MLLRYDVLKRALSDAPENTTFVVLTLKQINLLINMQMNYQNIVI